MPSCVQYLFAVIAVASTASSSTLRINEVSDKGTPGITDGCDGYDWIELYYDKGDDASSELDLSGYVLHDDKGPDGDDSFTFPSPSVIYSDQYLLLCTNVDDGTIAAAVGPQFGIGGTDSVTLLDPLGNVVSTTGLLQDRGSDTVTFAFDRDADAFVYTSTPTPGAVNTIVPLPAQETVDEMRTRLEAQNDMGTAFFNMDNGGLPVEDGTDAILDLRLEVDPSSWIQMKEDESYEVYTDFLSATVTPLNRSDDVLRSVENPGRFRPKGQSSLSVAVCMNRTVPYLIEWNREISNQTLFGMERSYLRSHFEDPSFVREWSLHRMLARFGLPFLRTRTVRLLVNSEYVGLYELMEAPDQDYVFQRSFPDFDPTNYGLFKVKTLSGNMMGESCGSYTEEGLEKSRARVMNETDDSVPYMFKRGRHRDKIEVTGDYGQCFFSFFETIMKESEDVTLAYVRDGEPKTCGEFFVGNGLVERDLGVKGMDTNMAEFVSKHLGSNTCDEQCANSNLEEDVDVNQFLRNIAVMSVMLHHDSPLGNGNNYYLAKTDGTDDNGWKMFQYDHNHALTTLASNFCDAESCQKEMMKFSIERPTCRALESSQMAGPLLTNKAYHAQYIKYVREFVRDVVTNDEFQQQVFDHLVAIKDEAAKDSWGIDFSEAFGLELSPDDKWSYELAPGFYYIPFLPAVRSRAAEVQKQLDAIDSGTFPRLIDDIGPDEVCINWELDKPRESPCFQGCHYEGCLREDLLIPALCMSDGEMCVHGTLDDRCANVTNLEDYDGIENFEGSDKKPFCSMMMGVIPVKMAECPAPPPITDSDKTVVVVPELPATTESDDVSLMEETSSAVTFSSYVFFFLTAIAVLIGVLV